MQLVLQVLEQVMNHMYDYPVAFVLTKHLSTPSYLEHFFSHLLVRDKIDFIELQPLNFQDSVAYLQAQKGIEALSEEKSKTFIELARGSILPVRIC